MSEIGMVGLGAMGGRIAGRLLGAGHVVHGTNRTRAKAEDLITEGLGWCDTPRTAAQASDVVISMVTDDEALAAVTEGPDGILAGLTAEMVYVDMSTVSPHASRALAERVAARGAAMVAAPVSGSVSAVESGTLAIIAGGPADAFGRIEPILDQLGSRVMFVGGDVGSPMLQTRAPLLRELPEEAWFDIAKMQKDLRLALGSGRDEGVRLPTAAVADEMLGIARTAGYEHRDIAAVFSLLSDLVATS